MESPHRHSHPPLCQAARDGDRALLNQLLDSGGRADERDAQGITALMHACMQNRLDCAKLLVSRGADLDLIDGFSGLSALGWCANHLRPDCMRLLLLAGASPNNRARNGQTPLAQCSASLHNWPEAAGACFKHLAEHPLADLNATSPQGLTAAMLCAFYGQAEHARLLAERGADFSLRCPKGFSFVDYAREDHFDHLPQSVAALVALAEACELAGVAPHARFAPPSTRLRV
jgi:ankyrin repeat protein